MAGLPDPEMRKFLVPGTVEGVRLALSPHTAMGMIITFSEDGKTCNIGSPDGTEEVALPTSQQLKLTVREANKVMGEVL